MKASKFITFLVIYLTASLAQAKESDKGSLIRMKCPHGVRIGATCYNCGKGNGYKATAEKSPDAGNKPAK